MVHTAGKLLIQDGILVTMNGAGDLLHGDLLIEDGRIAQIGQSLTAADATVVEASGSMVLPGFIQGHVALNHSLCRFWGESLEAPEFFRRRAAPMEAAHDEQTLRAAVDTGVAELLASGTTAFASMETVHGTDVIVEALQDWPIHAMIGHGLMDRTRGIPKPLRRTTTQNLEAAASFLERSEARPSDGRIRRLLAPRSTSQCSFELLRESAALAREHGARLHLQVASHPSEHRFVRRRDRCSPMELVHRAGLFESSTMLVDPICASASDFTLASEHAVGVVFQGAFQSMRRRPFSTAKLARSTGLAFGISCGSAAANGNLDMFEALRQFAHGVGRTLPMTPYQILATATSEAARTLGWQDEMGSLEVGKRANVLLLDTPRQHWEPLRDPHAAVIHAGHARDLRLVVVDGEVIVSRGRLQTHSDADIKREARRAAQLLALRACFPDRPAEVRLRPSIQRHERRPVLA